MKNPSLKALSRNAVILACIIAVVRSLNYWGVFLEWPAITTAIYWIFPHEVLGDISLLLFANAGLFLRNFPIFTFLLPVMLVLSAILLKKKGKTLPLKLCYCCLILSILLSIPGLITGYQYMVDLHNEQMAAPHSAQQGILGLIDSFAEMSKPSLPLLIGQVVILLGYAAWCGWQIKGLYALDKKTRLSP